MIRVKDEIFERMDQLSRAEKKVARVLLADYPAAGLITASALAHQAGTSTPTVLRLVAHLGCGSYPDFQKQLRDEITQQATSPVVRTAMGRGQLFGGSLLEKAVTRRGKLLDSLLACLPPTEFDEVITLLAAKPRHVVISGGHFTRALAQLLAFQLDQIIPNVAYAADPLEHDISKYLALRRDSVAIVFDFRRYEQSARDVSALVKARGGMLIVVTDQELSPSIEYADIVLPVPVDGIPYDSLVTVLALIECVVEGLLREVGNEGLKRMREWEESVHIPRVFDHAAPPTTR